MNLQALLALFDQEMRIDIEYPEARKEVLPDVVRFVRPAPGMNFVSYSSLDPATAANVIQEQVTYFAPMEQPFEWLVYEHDRPLGLIDQLSQYGFRPDDDPSVVMLLKAEDAPPALLAPVTVDLRAITRREELADVIMVLETVYGGDFGWVTQRLGGHLEIPGYLSVRVARVDGQPASVAWMYLHPNSQFASLWAGSTVATYRGRGLYTALLAARVQEAIQRGYRYTIVDTNPNSRPIVAKYGFRPLTVCHSCRWQGEPAA